MSSNGGTLLNGADGVVEFRAATLRGMSLQDRVTQLDRCLSGNIPTPTETHLVELPAFAKQPTEEVEKAAKASKRLPPLRERLSGLWHSDSKSGEISLFILSIGWSLILDINPMLFEGTRGHYDGVAHVAAEWFWGILLGVGALSILLGLLLRRNAARHAGVLLCGAVWSSAALAQFLGSPTFSPTPMLLALVSMWVYLRLPSNGTF